MLSISITKTRTCRTRLIALSTLSRFRRLIGSRCSDQKLTIAIIGAGPAGFYTAHRILLSNRGASIDIYEALPAPFGLVRYGVAPDHQVVKNCEERFSKVAQSSRVRFLGNVIIGQKPHDGMQMSIPLSVLRRNYNAIIFAYGAATDRPLHVPGETGLLGVYSARQFVGWYNGHPDHSSLAPDLSGHDCVIIGHGNVSMDIARILLADVDDLRQTDISEQALAQLCTSRIKHVRVVGRRGPIQASFAVKEFRELLKFPLTSLSPDLSTLTPDNMSRLPRPSRRLIETMHSAVTGRPRSSAPRSWSLDFCLSPKRFIGTRLAGASNPQVSFTMFEKGRLLDASEVSSRIEPQGETICYPSQTVFRSVGYRIGLIEGLSQCGASLDERTGALRHDGNGRLISSISATVRPPAGEASWSPRQTASPLYQSVPGLYCSGWAKQGPTGVIASTMMGGYETADALCQDWQAGRPFLDTHLSSDAQVSPHSTLSHDSIGNEIKLGWEGVKGDEDVINVSTAKVVMWEDWQRLNEIEIMRGRPLGKPREKVVTRSELLRHVT